MKFLRKMMDSGGPGGSGWWVGGWVGGRAGSRWGGPQSGANLARELNKFVKQALLLAMLAQTRFALRSIPSEIRFRTYIQHVSSVPCCCQSDLPNMSPCPRVALCSRVSPAKRFSSVHLIDHALRCLGLAPRCLGLRPRVHPGQYCNTCHL